MSKTELCEPCEWAGMEVPANHFVGWDNSPLCDFHYEIHRGGRLGNWVNENVDFTPPEETPTEPREVEAGKIGMAISTQDLINRLGIPEEISDDKVDSLLFGEKSQDVNSGTVTMKMRGRTSDALVQSFANPTALSDKAEVLRKLEEDAWYYLKGAGAGSIHCLHIVTYLIATLDEYDVDVSNLEFSLENLRKNG